MFYNCENLSNLDLSNFDTRLVKNMSYMFRGMSNITSLDLSKFDTTNVTNMIQMFGGDTKLTSITYDSNFIHNTEATTNAMFGGTYNGSTTSLCPANKPNAELHPSWDGVSFD